MNLLIVDDQKQVLDGIRTSINFREIPAIADVYYALNSREAKDVFLTRSVDILISDIEMPGENGLQLLSWVGANFPETKCILLTAHASFDYAQDAIRLKAVDYILQPVRYEVLRNAIMKAAQQILQEEAERSPDGNRAFWNSFHENAEQMILKDFFNSGDLDQLLDKAARMNLPLLRDADYCLILINESLENGSLDSWAEVRNKSKLLSLAVHFYSQLCNYFCVFEQHSHHFWMLLRAENPSEDFVSSTQSFIGFCRENDDISLVVYLGNPARLEAQPAIYERLYRLYTDNVAYVEKLFTLDSPVESPKPPMPASASWSRYFCSNTPELIEDVITEYIRRTADNDAMTQRTLLSLQQTFLNAFYESLHERGIRIREVFEQEELFEAFTRSTRSTESFLHFVRLILRYTTGLIPQPEKEGGSIIETAQEYIAAHLSEELSRETISREIHVSESYLSHLFPKETGMPLTDYITKERMALAKSLLTTTSLPVQMVAIKAGYNNISYFIRTFKKTFSVTPNDFRKSRSG